jgi:3-dehydroshikimate dehydratase
MFRISCFADEISADLQEQIDVMIRNCVQYVELRSVWNKNVLDLSDSELEQVKVGFFSKGIRVSSIGSPIGKVNIADDFKEHMNRFQRAVEIAKIMDAPYIRIFSFYIKKEELDLYEEEVIDRMRQMLAVAEKNGVVLLHENEADIYGESSASCLKLFRSLQGMGLRAVFDPSNFVAAGENVYEESFPKLKQYIEYMHIKDSIKATGEVVAAGQGDGNIREILNELRDREGMFLSLEPHLAHAGRYQGFSGPALYEKALKALRDILNELGIDYE